MKEHECQGQQERKKSGLHREREKPIIKYKWVAESKPKQDPNRKKHWSQNSVPWFKKKGRKKEVEDHMGPEEKHRKIKQGKIEKLR